MTYKIEKLNKYQQFQINNDFSFQMTYKIEKLNKYQQSYKQEKLYSYCIFWQYADSSDKPRPIFSSENEGFFHITAQ